MEFLSLAKKRYSARKFTSQKVDNKELANILEAGRIAPTAANMQPQRIMVIQTDIGLKKLAKAVNFYNAPIVLLVCADKTKAWVRDYDGKNTSDIDSSIVTTHMMIAAADIGLDSLWMTWFNPDILRSEFSIPENFEPINLLALGYNADSAPSSERHSSSRIPLTDTVFYDNYLSKSSCICNVNQDCSTCC